MLCIVWLKIYPWVPTFIIINQLYYIKNKSEIGMELVLYLHQEPQKDYKKKDTGFADTL